MSGTLLRNTMIMLAALAVSSNAFANTVAPSLSVKTRSDSSVELNLSIGKQDLSLVKYVELERADKGSASFSAIAHFAHPKRHQIFIDHPAAGELYQYRARLVTKARATAKSSAKTVALASPQSAPALMSADAQAAMTSRARPVSLHHPSKHMAYVLLTFSDRPATPPYTKEVAEQGLAPFTSYFDEISYGRTLSQGKVFGWYRLPNPSSFYGGYTDTLAQAAVKAADKDIDFSQYDFVIMIVDDPSRPPNSAHYLEQYLSTGEGSSYLYFSYWNSQFPSIHEVGHDLGFGHAGVIYCGNQSIAADLTQCDDFGYTYGDNYDPMGGGFEKNGLRHAHFNARHKNALGMFLDSEIPAITQSGDYTIDPFELASSPIKALRVMDPTYPTVVKFWVEFRQPIGSDGYLTPSLVDGAMIRIPFGLTTSTSNVGPDSDIVDCTPVEKYGDYRADVVCHSGQTMFDPGSKISIKTTKFVAASQGKPAQLTVHVEFNSSGPGAVAPALSSISPTLVSPGDLVTLTGSGFLASGNTVHFGSFTLSNLGSTTGASLQFSVPAAATTGDYSVTVENANGTSNAMHLNVGGGRTTLSCPALALTSDLAVGSSDLLTGGQVSALQGFLWQYDALYPKWKLAKLGYDKFVTGLYNKKTKAIVTKFQKSFGLLPKHSTESGKVQALTRAAILAQCGG